MCLAVPKKKPGSSGDVASVKYTTARLKGTLGNSAAASHSAYSSPELFCPSGRRLWIGFSVLFLRS